MDTIFLSEVKVETRLGVPAWERMTRQTVVIDLEMAMPHNRACHTDTIEDTIDYGEVVKRIRQTLAEHSFQLVEALAEHVCQIVLAEFGTPWVKVRISKPGILSGVKALGVTLERASAG